MSTRDVSALAEEMIGSCLNSRARILARVVTGIYDDALRELGIKASQLNLLAAIGYAGTVRRTDLGRHLHLDTSTLTRNLRVMETNGWIEDAPDHSDGRGQPVRLTATGRKMLESAAPAWRTAQRHTAKLLGPDGKASVLQLVDRFTAA